MRKKDYPQDGMFDCRCKIPGKRPQLYHFAHGNKREFERSMKKESKTGIKYLGRGVIHSIGGKKQGYTEKTHFWLRDEIADVKKANAEYRKSRLLL